MIALACVLLLGWNPAVEIEGPDQLADRVEVLLRAGDAADSNLIEPVAELGTQESLDALIEFCGGNRGSYARVAILRSLKAYSGDDDVAVPALDFLVQQATSSSEESVRAAAVETIAKFQVLGRGYLRALVGLPAPDNIRLRALMLHTQRADSDDHRWYRKLAEPDDSKRKKRLPRDKKGNKDTVEFAIPLVTIRRAAFRAAAETYTSKGLIALFKLEQDSALKLAILQELAGREHRVTTKLAQELLTSTLESQEIRQEAASILASALGPKSFDLFVDQGTKGNTSTDLSLYLASLVAETAKPKDRAKLVKRIGRGSMSEQLFTLGALHGYQDAGAVVKIRKSLTYENPDLLAAQVRYLGSAGLADDIPLLTEIMDSAEDRGVIRECMQALSSLHDEDAVWGRKLAAYARGMDPIRGPLAVAELSRRGAAGSPELFLNLLTHEAWATRLAAMEVLVARRELDLLGPIITQMQQEEGRLQAAFGEGLFELTGQLYGKRAVAWKSWYEDQGKGLALLTEAELAEARLMRAEHEARERTEVAKFFGIEVESERVIFIIDISGSMEEKLRGRYLGEPGEPRIERAKSQLIHAIQDMNPTSQFNIIAFSREVHRWSDRSVGAEEAPAKDAAIDWISRLGAFGGTNLYGALSLAFDDLYVDTIVLLSDGEPSVGKLRDPLAIRSEFRKRNEGRRVIIHSVALGSELSTLEWLSLDSGGTYVSHME